MITCRQDEERGRERCYVAGLEHGGKEAQAKDCRRPLEAEKAEGTDFFPAPPKGAQPCRHLDCRTPDLPNCKIIKSVLFEAIKFVICYSSHGKPIQQVCKGPRDERSWGSRLNPSQLEDPTFPSCHSLPYNTVCVCVCGVCKHMLLHTCVCVHLNGGPSRKDWHSQLPPGPRALAGWHCRARCAVSTPTFPFRSLWGNALTRNTKGKKCHRSTAHSRGPARDK